MPEPVALAWRGRLGDNDAVNLTIVLDDGRKLPNCLAPAHSPLQRIENIFEPIIHVVDLERATLKIQPHLNGKLGIFRITHALFLHRRQR